MNGVPQTEGKDYEAIGSSLLFPRPIEPERKMGFWRWALLALGVMSSYKHHDSVDVVYTVDGRRAVATLKPVEAPPKPLA